MVKPKLRKAKRLSKGTRKKYICPTCKKRTNRFHKCSGKTTKQKKKERQII